MSRVRLSEPKVISNPRGNISRILRATENDFAGFGEAYLTSINEGATKGWKKHARMVMNLVVPHGKVGFYLLEEDSGNKTYVELGEDNYKRLCVMPGVWMAFRGLAQGSSLVLNIASIEHDPAEAINRGIDEFELDDWLG